MLSIDYKGVQDVYNYVCILCCCGKEEAVAVSNNSSIQYNGNEYAVSMVCVEAVLGCSYRKSVSSKLSWLALDIAGAVDVRRIDREVVAAAAAVLMLLLACLIFYITLRPR